MLKIGRDMANERFPVCQRITVILAWFGLVHKGKNQDQITEISFGEEPMLMWPYLSQFLTHSTDVAHLEFFVMLFWDIWSKLKTPQKDFFVTLSLRYSILAGSAPEISCLFTGMLENTAKTF